MISLPTIDEINGGKNENELFEDLKWLIKNQLDFSAPENSCVFYSGKNRKHAVEWAEFSRSKTLEMTEGGGYLDSLDL